MAERNTRTFMGLVAAAAMVAALPAAAAAQETQRADTSAAQDTLSRGRAQADTAGQDTTHWGHETTRDPQVQNPPGYRGMERPVNVFPPDTAGDTTTAGRDQGQMEGQATGTYQDPAWDDTTGAQQNPPGYRGMERPAELDTAAGGRQGEAGRTGATGMTEQTATQQTDEQEIEQYRQRLGEMGYKVEKMSKSEKKAWKERNRGGQDDTQQQGGTADRQQQSGAGADTTRVGETTPKVPEDTARRLPAEQGDTTGQGGAEGTNDQR